MSQNESCRFCNAGLENSYCKKCGCLNLSRKITDENVNAGFLDYSYNFYQENPFLQRVYLNWIRLQTFLFSRNTALSQTLNFLLAPIVGGKPRINFSAKEAFLDVGCGRGDFLRYLPKAWYVQGCDIVAYPDQPKCVVVGNFEKLHLPKKYTIVRASHTLEHSLHPQNFLEKLVENIQKGGLIVISSPNSDSYAYRIFKKNWLPFNVGSHFCLLNINSVSDFLKSHGCEILHAGTYNLFSEAGSLSLLFGGKKYISALFAFFAFLLLPFNLLGFLTNKADSFIIYARKI